MVSMVSRYRIDFSVLLIGVAIVYGRLAGYDFQINGDDSLYVLNNPDVQGLSWEHIKAAFGPSSIGQYNPLALLSFMLDHEFWGFNPAGYHATNILIHAANGLIVYHLLERLQGDRFLSLFVSALFLFHPVQVESVAWISERKGLLSMLFMLVSWQAYLSYRASIDTGRKLYYIASLSAFLLSLLAKPMTVVFPVLLVLFDLSFPVSGQRTRFLDKFPFFIAAAVFSAIVMYSEMPHHGGGRVDYHGGSGVATFLTMLPVFCRYLWMLVWPANLSIEYVPSIHQTIDGMVLLAALVLAGIVASGILLFKTDRRLWFWLALFWLALLPVSQIVPLSNLMFDHYLYLPILGMAVLTGSGVIRLRNRFGAERVRPAYLVVIIWLVLLGGVSFNRVAVWNNYWTLWMDAAVKSPGSVKVWITLGEAYQRDGNLQEAIKAYEHGLALNPSSTDSLWRLGNLYTEQGQLEKGKGFLLRTLAINPTYVMAWATLGNNYLELGNYSEAEKAYRRAMALQPDAMQVIIALGRLSVLQGDFDKARDFYTLIEAKGWNDPQNAYRMACLESLAGRRNEGLVWMETALKRGYRDYPAISTNKDLAGLWNDPRFMLLLSQYFPELEPIR